MFKNNHQYILCKIFSTINSSESSFDSFNKLCDNDSNKSDNIVGEFSFSNPGIKGLTSSHGTIIKYNNQVLIVTCNHCVSETYKKLNLYITYENNKTSYNARIVPVYRNQFYDLAFCKFVKKDDDSFFRCKLNNYPLNNSEYFFDLNFTGVEWKTLKDKPDGKIENLNITNIFFDCVNIEIPIIQFDYKNIKLGEYHGHSGSILVKNNKIFAIINKNLNHTVSCLPGNIIDMCLSNPILYLNVFMLNIDSHKKIDDLIEDNKTNDDSKKYIYQVFSTISDFNKIENNNHIYKNEFDEDISLNKCTVLTIDGLTIKNGFVDSFGFHISVDCYCLFQQQLKQFYFNFEFIKNYTLLYENIKPNNIDSFISFKYSYNIYPYQKTSSNNIHPKITYYNNIYFTDLSYDMFIILINTYNNLKNSKDKIKTKTFENALLNFKNIKLFVIRYKSNTYITDGFKNKKFESYENIKKILINHILSNDNKFIFEALNILLIL